MQLLAQGEQHGHRDRRADGDAEVAQHRIGAERKSQRGGNDRGDAVGLLRPRLEPGESPEHGDVAQEHEAEHGRVGQRRQRRRDAPEQARDGEGAEPRRALPVLLVAGLPAALEPDEQADGECHGQPHHQVRALHAPAPFGRLQRRRRALQRSARSRRIGLVSLWDKFPPRGLPQHALASRYLERDRCDRGTARAIGVRAGAAGWPRCDGLQQIEAGEQGRARALALDRERRQNPRGDGRDLRCLPRQRRRLCADGLAQCTARLGAAARPRPGRLGWLFRSGRLSAGPGLGRSRLPLLARRWQLRARSVRRLDAAALSRRRRHRRSRPPPRRGAATASWCAPRRARCW